MKPTKRDFRLVCAVDVARTRILAICGLCQGVYKGANCPKCGDTTVRKQHFFVDGPTEGWYPEDTGFPRAGHDEPGKRLNRICPSKRAWKEYVARSEGRVEDVS